MSDHVQEFEHTLTKKAGPLPVWAWGLAIGLILIILLWLHNRNIGNTTATTAYDDTATQDGTDASLSDSNGFDNAYQQGYAAGGGGIGSSGDVVTDTTGTNTDGTAGNTVHTPRTNQSWLRRATAALVADGVGGIRAGNILNKYLKGGPLNKKQRQIVNQAIQNTGLPPSVPQHVSVNTHQQSPTHAASPDHTVSPHVSNSGNHGGNQHGAGQGPPRRHHPQPHAAGSR